MEAYLQCLDFKNRLVILSKYLLNMDLGENLHTELLLSRYLKNFGIKGTFRLVIMILVAGEFLYKKVWYLAVILQ